MALTNKEKSRRYVQKLKSDPMRHEDYLTKERERYQKENKQITLYC